MAVQGRQTTSLKRQWDDQLQLGFRRRLGKDWFEQKFIREEQVGASGGFSLAATGGECVAAEAERELTSFS